MTRARRSLAPTPIGEAVAFEHCGEAEYDAFLAELPVTQGFRAMRRRYRCAFVERWPRIEDWFDAPFEERVGRLAGETQKRPSYPASYRARSYLFYLALTGRLRLDYDWLLTVGDLCVAPVASGLGIDLGVVSLAEQGARHGYRLSSISASMSWTMSRLFLRHGLGSADEVHYKHIEELLDAIERFDHRQNTSGFRNCSVFKLKRSWRINARQLQLLLYHRGQLREYPTLPTKRRDPPPSDRPIMQAAVDRWIAIRRLTLSGKTVGHQVVSLRHFMTDIVVSAPEVERFADLNRDHALGFVDLLRKSGELFFLKEEGFHGRPEADLYP